MAIQEILSKRMKGVQVRVGQGPGQTRFLAYRKHGGPEATRRLAKDVERELEARWGKKSHNAIGRLMRNNVSGIPGLRFEWRTYSQDTAYLYLVGSYRNAAGRPCAFAYSVDKHGFDEVLRRGLAMREKHGAPNLTFEDAKERIWAHYLKQATL